MCRLQFAGYGTWAVLQSVLDQYERMIAELKAELASVRKTPWNSSLPPSTEHPHAPPARGRARHRRRRPRRRSENGVGRRGIPNTRGRCWTWSSATRW